MKRFMSSFCFYITFIGSFIGLLLWMKYITDPKIIDVGPNNTVNVSENKIISSDGGKSLSFKSDCDFVLKDIKTGELKGTVTVPPQLGENGPSYVITDIVLVGKHSPMLCPVTVFAREATTIILERNLVNIIASCVMALVSWFIAVCLLFLLFDL